MCSVFLQLRASLEVLPRYWFLCSIGLTQGKVVHAYPYGLVISKWSYYLGSKRKVVKNGSWTKETPSKEAPDIILLTFCFLSCIFLLTQVNLTPDNGLLCHISVNVKMKPQVHSGDHASYFWDHCLGPYTFQNTLGIFFIISLGYFLFYLCDFLMFLTDPYLWSL